MKKYLLLAPLAILVLMYACQKEALTDNALQGATTLAADRDGHHGHHPFGDSLNHGCDSLHNPLDSIWNHHHGDSLHVHLDSLWQHHHDSLHVHHEPDSTGGGHGGHGGGHGGGGHHHGGGH